MQINSEPPPGLEPLAQADIFNHGYLPVAAAYCRHLGLIELVDRMVATQMSLRPGLVVQAMVLDVLSGRTPLYRVENFLSEQDVELLLGEAVPAHAFNDSTLARSLDAIFVAGTSKIVTELGVRATGAFHLDPTIASYDTTSTTVWGAYSECESEQPPEGPCITYGHSKDNHPDLKQFMTEILCVDRGVPIFGRTLDGNSSDKTSNNRILSRIGAIMAAHGLGPGAFVYVADSAMVTKNNLEAMEHTRFISRLPATYAACDKAIADAIDSGSWIDLGSMTEHPVPRSRPCAVYTACESSVVLYENQYRAVVVHSSSHDKRRQKKLDKHIVDSASSIKAELGRLQTMYFCEADAQAASAQAKTFSDRLHTVETVIRPVEVRRRGRPSLKGPTPTHTRYELSWNLVPNTAGIERQRTLAGCFVLLTTVPIEGLGAMDATGVLRTYKGQYGVESDFAFLKDPLIVNDLFLKTPSRIDALGMVLIIALMIWRLMERTMRVHMETTQTTVPGWDGRNTHKPTSFMMTTAMTGIMVAVIGGIRHFLHGPGPRQLAFLNALGLGPPVFLDPRYHCVPIIPADFGSKG